MSNNLPNTEDEQYLKKMIFFCDYMTQARSEALDRYRIIGEKSIKLFYILSGVLTLYGFFLSLSISALSDVKFVDEMVSTKVFLALSTIVLIIIVLFLISAFMNIIKSMETSSYQIPQINNASQIADSFSTLTLAELYRQFGEAHETWIKSIDECHKEKNNKITNCISSLYMAFLFSIMLLMFCVLFFFIR